MLDVARRALTFGALAVLSSLPIGHAAEQATLSGTAIYRERMLLPPGAVFEAALVDASRADAPAEVIAITQISEPGAALLVTLTGRIEQRPKMEGEGTQESLVVEKFEQVWPGEECPPREAALANTRWRLVGLGETSDDRLPEKKRPWLRFTDKDARMHGFSGCNNLMGSYRVEGDGLQLGQLAGTQMFCQDTAALEQEFLSALKAVTGYRIDGDKLVLTANGDVRRGARTLNAS